MSGVEKLEELRDAASRGDLAAKTRLGKRMIAEPTSRESFQEGQNLVKQAFEAGSGEAAEFIAIMQATGASGQQNWPLALDYLTQAASLGWTPALQQLAILADHRDEDGNWGSRDITAKDLRNRIDLNTLLNVPEKEILCQSPRIRKCETFLSPRFCEWMIARARPKLGRAKTYDEVVSEGRESEARTNSAMSFGPLDLDLILLLIQSRISKITDLPIYLMEKSSILHYEVGQQFRPHYDYLDPTKPTHAEDMGRMGQRLATCLIYLNEDFDGAETAFPKLGQKFRCRTGGLLFFANVDQHGQGDPNTLHAGLPPTRGEKWLFSQWIRTGPPPRNG